MFESRNGLSTVSEHQRNSHRLRGGTGVGKPLTFEDQRRRRILRDTACRWLDLFSLAGMQDKQKALRSRPEGFLYAEISMEHHPTQQVLRGWVPPSAHPPPLD